MFFSKFVAAGGGLKSPFTNVLLSEFIYCEGGVPVRGGVPVSGQFMLSALARNKQTIDRPWSGHLVLQHN